MNQLHPTMQTILASHVMSMNRASVLAYIAMLQDHDWHSDSKNSVESMEIMIRLQFDLDPDFKIWNEHCPAEFRRTV